MKKLDKAEKWLVGILIFCIILLLGQGIAILVFNRKIDMPVYIHTTRDYYTAYAILETDYELPQSQTDEEYRETIAKEAGLGLYFYAEKNLGNEYNGATLAVIRTIIIDERLAGEEYCMVFTHETMHLTKYSSNETYISFETFKFLYESADKYLHNAGVLYGLKQLQGYYRGEYNCHDYIINYLVKGDTL